MRIMTFNIQHALDFKRQVIDTDFFAKAIAENGADFCCLNEVRNNGPIDGYTDQTNEIGDKLGYYRYFGQAVLVDGTSPYGNAIVSKYKFKSCETIEIPETESTEEVYCEPRCVIKAVADINGKEICFLNCHMGLSHPERVKAVETLCTLIDSTPLPIILTGDFNTTPDDDVLKPIYSRLKDADETAQTKGKFTYSSINPQIKIDYIFYRDLDCKASEVVEKVYSDHFPITADFEI